VSIPARQLTAMREELEKLAQETALSDKSLGPLPTKPLLSKRLSAIYSRLPKISGQSSPAVGRAPATLGLSLSPRQDRGVGSLGLGGNVALSGGNPVSANLSINPKFTKNLTGTLSLGADAPVTGQGNWTPRGNVGLKLDF